MSGPGVPKHFLTHAQRVCRLYKKAYRTMEMTYNDAAAFRFEAVLLRHRFDESRKELDQRKLAAMVQEAEEECFRKQHSQPFISRNDPDGILYDRYCEPDDFVLDWWHPWEKAKYIDFFEKRELRKKEYDAYYENVIAKKGQRLIEHLEFPAPVPTVAASK